LGRPRINGETEQAIRSALADGKGIRKVAKECGVGVSVVQRVKAERTNGELPRPA
jgi:transposase